MQHNLYAVTRYWKATSLDPINDPLFPEYSVHDLVSDDTPQAAIEYLKYSDKELDLGTGFAISPLTKSYLDIVTILMNSNGELELTHELVR